MVDLTYLAGYAAAQHNWPDAQVITPPQLASQAPTGPPLIVTSTSKDLTSDTARTIAALHTTGRGCILVTDQPPPDTITQWLPNHACITPGTINDSPGSPQTATNDSGETLEEALNRIRDPEWVEVGGSPVTEFIEERRDYDDYDFVGACRAPQDVPVQLIPDRWTVWQGILWDYGSMQDESEGDTGQGNWHPAVLAMLHFKVAGVDCLAAATEHPEGWGGLNLRGFWLNGSSVTSHDRADGRGKEYRWGGMWATLTGGSAFPWLGTDVPPALPAALAPTTPAYRHIDIGISAFVQNLGLLLLDWGTVNLPPPLVVDSFNAFWNSLMSEDLLT